MQRLIIKDKRYLKEAVRGHLFHSSMDALNTLIAKIRTNQIDKEEEKSLQTVVFYLLLVMFTLVSFTQIHLQIYTAELKRLKATQEENK
jgi:hypothetical protein